ncbi:MAG: aminotransferase class V-fold PLP-dependent enzyme [Deltaproteobacteria bacterium]|nr:aminotransferase class V-fold PLP-dependent enzyme [Deltaproteobacteria bacterium]
MAEFNLKKWSLAEYRVEFPVTKKFIYLDHAAVAPLSKRVKDAVIKFLTEATESAFFKYSYWMGRVEEIRGKCAELVGSEKGEIAFVKNTSHGISLVAEGLGWREGDNVIVFEREFPSNIYPWLNLERKGVKVKFIPARGNMIYIDDIEKMMDTNTRLLSISSVQFSNGFRVEMDRLGEMCRKKKILLFVDAIQSLGIVPMNVRELGIDFLTSDGHKWLLGPEGAGIFYCRKDLAEILKPSLIGWKSVVNENDYDHIDFRLKTNSLRFEEGSLNVMGIMALGAAVDLLLEVGIDRINRRILDLGDLILEESEKRGLEIRSPKDRKHRAGINSITGNFNPVDVKDRLRATGILVNIRSGAIRVAPHFYNTDDEILTFFSELDKLI